MKESTLPLPPPKKTQAYSTQLSCFSRRSKSNNFSKLETYLKNAAILKRTSTENCKRKRNNTLLQFIQQTHYLTFKGVKLKTHTERKRSGKTVTTSTFITRCLLIERGDEWEVRSAWRELSFSWEREQPITVCPRLANSRARAFPSPLLTPVISTVRWFPGTLAAIVAVLWAPNGVVGVAVIRKRNYFGWFEISLPHNFPSLGYTLTCAGYTPNAFN